MSALKKTLSALDTISEPTLVMRERTIMEEIFYFFNCAEESIQTLDANLPNAIDDLNGRSVYSVFSEIQSANNNFKNWSFNCLAISHFPVGLDELDSIQKKFEQILDNAQTIEWEIYKLSAGLFASYAMANCHALAGKIKDFYILILSEFEKARVWIKGEEAGTNLPGVRNTPV